MRSYLKAVVVSLILPSALTADTSFWRVTPETVESWSVAGADRLPASSSDTVTVPAGAQLSRNFAGTAIVLNLVTQPHWAEESTEWPILEAGPAALALVKRGDEGRLLLLVGGHQQIELPATIAAEKPAQPFSVVLGYDALTGIVVAGADDEAWFFKGQRSAHSIGVVLTSGDGFDWPLSSLDLVVLGDGVTNRAGRSSETAGDKKPNEERRAQLVALSSELRGQSVRSHSGQHATVATPTSTPFPSASLEIYTPPSVPRGRVGELRAAIAGKLQR